MSETIEATETPNTTTEVKNTSSAQSQLSEEELKSQTDCYFYLHNNCTKGDRCEFRHSEAALATQAVCREWVLDNCPRGVDCPSRHPSKQPAPTTFKPKPYFKPAYSAPYHAPHYPSYHHAPPVDRSQTPCYYFLMGQCAKGAACPFSHQFVKAEDANKKSAEDTDKALKFSVKNDSAKEDRPSNNRNNNRDESSSNKSRDRDENSRHSDDSGRQRRPRQEANVVFELPNNRKHEQRARSNSDVKHNNNNNNRARDQHDNNRSKDQTNNNNGRKQVRQQERDSVNSVSFASSKEERQKQREQERAKAESGQKASFGVQRLSNLLPGQEAGTKRARDNSAEEGPNKRRKVENGAAMSKDDLDRELDELNLPPPPASDGNDEELLDI